MQNKLEVGTLIGKKRYTYKGTKAFLKGRKTVYLFILVNFRALGSGSAFRTAKSMRDPDTQHCY